MKLKKLFKVLDKETIFNILDTKGDLYATGNIEDFLDVFSESPALSKKVLEVHLKSNERYLYLDIVVEI